MSTGQPTEAPEFDHLFKYDDPQGTEKALTDLLEPMRASGDRGKLIELLTQIARSQGLQKKFDEAQQTLDDAKSLLEQGDTVPRIRYLLELGRKYRSSGEPEKGKPLFEEAWNVAKEAGNDRFGVDALHMLAICCEGKEALEWSEQAFAVVQKTDCEKTKRWMGPLCNNMGWQYHEMGEYQRSLELFQAGLDYHTQAKSGMPERIAKWTVARALRSLERHEDAIKILEELNSDWEKAGGKSGFAFEELGENHLALGRNDEAKTWFAQAYDELKDKPDVADEQPDRLKRIGELGGRR